VVEFAEQAAELGLVGLALRYSGTGKPIKDTELFLAQSFVSADWIIAHRTARFAKQPGGLERTPVRRTEQDIGPLFWGAVREPVTQGMRLAFAERTQRDIHVTAIERDAVQFGTQGGIARDISRALTVPDQP